MLTMTIFSDDDRHWGDGNIPCVTVCSGYHYFTNTWMQHAAQIQASLVQAVVSGGEIAVGWST